MKIFRIILLVLFTLADAYCIYSTVGYCLIGKKDYPAIFGIDGVKDTTFTGMYIMAITFGVLALIFTIVIISLIVKLVKSRRR